MTEAEELELLELEAEAAGLTAPSVSPPSGPPAPGAGEAVGRAAVQGATAGFGDELNAAVQAMPDWARWLNPAGVVTGPLKALAEATSGVPKSQREAAEAMGPSPGLGTRLQQYVQARDAERAGNRAAKEANPKLSLATEVVSGLPLMLALPGARGAGVAKGAASGALAGGLGGLGGSTADLTEGDVGGAALDTGIGAGAGAALGAAAGGLGRLVERARAGVRTADADQALLQWAKASKGERVARSSLGGEVAAVLNEGRRAEEALASNIASPQAKAAAQALLSDPAFLQRYNSAMLATIESGAARLPGTVQTAQNVLQTARAAKSPDAILAATEAAQSSPLTSQVLPRLKTLATRMVPTSVGAALGGPAGAAVGGVVGAVQGAPGTALRNMLVNPATRRLGWRLLEALGRAGASPATVAGARSALTPVLEETDAP